MTATQIAALLDVRTNLAGLGHGTADIEAILATPRRLADDAHLLVDLAQTAAMLTACGIDHGDKLDRALTVTMALADYTGMSLAESCSLVGRVHAVDRLNAAEVAHLIDLGLPVLTMLAEARGNDQAEAAVAIAQGDVDSEAFLALIHRTLVVGEQR